MTNFPNTRVIHGAMMDARSPCSSTPSPTLNTAFSSWATSSRARMGNQPLHPPSALPPDRPRSAAANLSFMLAAKFSIAHHQQVVPHSPISHTWSHPSDKKILQAILPFCCHFDFERSFKTGVFQNSFYFIFFSHTFLLFLCPFVFYL